MHEQAERHIYMLDMFQKLIQFVSAGDDQECILVSSDP